ncbi:hypothetical protein NIASO_14850 [Niabella soli DSM 19437]|uniref:Uncharacterized protein n=1 Tax=Niabella soli DSM 19437 TaxID=929713 RepID=W0F444_9BACT|nr:hypothetical protein NIASO_14850 [Niabella soli DSM 19437]
MRARFFAPLFYRLKKVEKKQLDRFLFVGFDDCVTKNVDLNILPRIIPFIDNATDAHTTGAVGT